jgi:hypothetical protein
MGFKQFLSESTAIDKFDVTKLELNDLLKAYDNAGYNVPSNERRYFIESIYKGFTKSGHVFAVVMEDNGDYQEEGTFYVSLFYVTLGKSGKLEAEPSGNPISVGVNGKKLSEWPTEEDAIKAAKSYEVK